MIHARESKKLTQFHIEIITLELKTQVSHRKQSIPFPKIKHLENLIFTFLWGNKPDKVNREDAKLSEKAGGLGIVDLQSF